MTKGLSAVARGLCRTTARGCGARAVLCRSVPRGAVPRGPCGSGLCRAGLCRAGLCRAVRCRAVRCRAVRYHFALTRAEGPRRRRILAVHRRDSAQKHGHHQSNRRGSLNADTVIRRGWC